MVGVLILKSGAPHPRLHPRSSGVVGVLIFKIRGTKAPSSELTGGWSSDFKIRGAPSVQGSILGVTKTGSRSKARPQARRQETLNAPHTKHRGRTRRNRPLATVRCKAARQSLFGLARAFSGLAVPLLAGGPGRRTKQKQGLCLKSVSQPGSP